MCGGDRLSQPAIVVIVIEPLGGGNLTLGGCEISDFIELSATKGKRK